jgi:nitrate reductase NapAB chaperone NapD
VRAIGYRSNPVIMTVRVSPSKRLEAFGRIKVLPAVEIYTVTGDVDFVLIVEQDRLDQVLGMLSKIDGVLETKSLVSIEVASHE